MAAQPGTLSSPGPSLRTQEDRQMWGEQERSPESTLLARGGSRPPRRAREGDCGSDFLARLVAGALRLGPCRLEPLEGFLEGRALTAQQGGSKGAPGTQGPLGCVTCAPQAGGQAWPTSTPSSRSPSAQGTGLSQGWPGLVLSGSSLDRRALPPLLCCREPGALLSAPARSPGPQPGCRG